MSKIHKTCYNFKAGFSIALFNTSHSANRKFICVISDGWLCSGKFRISFPSMKVLATAEQFSLLYSRHLQY